VIVAFIFTSIQNNQQAANQQQEAQQAAQQQQISAHQAQCAQMLAQINQDKSSLTQQIFNQCQVN
jgi:hypothetical protein